MGNIIDYIREYGAYSLQERPFSDEDSLALAQLAYLKLEGVVPPPEVRPAGVTLGEISHMKQKDKIFEDVFFSRDQLALFEAMRKSRRFQTMKIVHCVNRIDLGEESQFSAVTLLPEDDSVYIAFRGTDETVVGWKEDFRMAYEAPVRSQQLAAAYLDEAAGRYHGALLVGGHSKGGNLAVFAAMFCREEVRERIRRIYSLDGPGFLPGLREMGAYEEIGTRIRKIVPHSSVVGMLLEDADAYETVESSAFGMLQHNPFSWLIRDGKFVRVKDVYKGRKAALEGLNRWILSVPGEERAALIDDLFGILEACGTQKLTDLSICRETIGREMRMALKKLDKEKRSALLQTVRALLRMGRETAVHGRGQGK